jgi:hypothetical protein
VFFSSSGLKNRATHSNLSPTFGRRSLKRKSPLDPSQLPHGDLSGTDRELSRDRRLTRSSRTELPVSRVLRKLKRDASRIHVTRPSPSLLARDLNLIPSGVGSNIALHARSPFPDRTSPVRITPYRRSQRVVSAWRSFDRWSQFATEKSNQHGPVKGNIPEIPIIFCDVASSHGSIAN